MIFCGSVHIHCIVQFTLISPSLRLNETTWRGNQDQLLHGLWEAPQGAGQHEANSAVPSKGGVWTCHGPGWRARAGGQGHLQDVVFTYTFELYLYFVLFVSDCSVICHFLTDQRSWFTDKSSDWKEDDEKWPNGWQTDSVQAAGLHSNLFDLCHLYFEASHKGLSVYLFKLQNITLYTFWN